MVSPWVCRYISLLGILLSLSLFFFSSLFLPSLLFASIYVRVSLSFYHFDIVFLSKFSFGLTLSFASLFSPCYFFLFLPGPISQFAYSDSIFFSLYITMFVYYNGSRPDTRMRLLVSAMRGKKNRTT